MPDKENRTLREITEIIKSGGKVDYEELRFAFLAMEALQTFSSHSLMKLGEYEKTERKFNAAMSPYRMYEEDFNRVKAALNVSPKYWIGWNNDPDNPKYQERRAANKKILQAVVKKMRERGEGTA